MAQLKQFAATDISILLTGENGTGKSMLVDYIHRHSQRSEASLVSVNMGGISETLFESEMFGHVKGAFTDAKESRVGRFELAHQGTLFLDEIANVPLTQQATKQTCMQTSFENSDLSFLEIEKRVFSERLKSFAGNAKEAGDSLGLSRSAFYRRLEKLGL